MVKGLKVLRHRRTEGGCFSEFLVAKSQTEDIENRAPNTMKQQNALCNNNNDNRYSADVQQITLTRPSQSQASCGIDNSSTQPISNQGASTAATVAKSSQSSSSSSSSTTSSTTESSAWTAARAKQPPHSSCRSSDPSDNARRAKRRERNRLAAAKCRKKRQDQMEGLADECYELESSNSELQQQVAELASKKQQLLQLLHSHESECTISGGLQLPHLVDLNPELNPEFELDADPVIVDLSLEAEDMDRDSLMFSPPMLSSTASPQPMFWQQRPNELPLPAVSNAFDTNLASLETPTTLLTPVSSALIKAEMQS